MPHRQLPKVLFLSLLQLLIVTGNWVGLCFILIHTRFFLNMSPSHTCYLSLILHSHVSSLLGSPATRLQDWEGAQYRGEWPHWGLSTLQRTGVWRPALQFGEVYSKRIFLKKFFLFGNSAALFLWCQSPAINQIFLKCLSHNEPSGEPDSKAWIFPAAFCPKY